MVVYLVDVKHNNVLYVSHWFYVFYWCQLGDTPVFLLPL